MYMHIGADTVVRMEEIIGIFDLETASVGPITREFLAEAERGLLVTSLATDLPKSFILCDGSGGRRLYLSQVSPRTLSRRFAAACRGSLF